MANREFQGGVFSASIPGGRAGARITVTARGVSADAGNDGSFEVPYEHLLLERGGASGKMVLCRAREGGLTIFCEENGFLAALADQGSTAIEPILRVFAKEDRARVRRTVGVWASVAGVAALLAFAAPRGWSAVMDRAVRVLPVSVDKQLGDLAYTQLQGQLPEMNAPHASAALDAILVRLKAHAADAGDFDLRVRVVDSAVVNAFALPGGRLFFNRGLLAQAESAEEVAGVMAHELAHVTRRHGIRRVGQSLGLVAVIQLLVGDVGGLLALGKELLTMGALNRYSRAHEADADRTAVTILYRSGLDPTALVTFFERVKAAEGDVPEYLGWLSTHPTHEARIAAVQAQVRKLKSVPREPLAIDWALARSELGPPAAPQTRQTAPSKKAGRAQKGSAHAH